MKQIQTDLTREIIREYMRRGMDSGTASYHAARAAALIVSRMESGAPEAYWTAGMDGFFKKLVKKISSPFKKIGKEAERVGKKIEKQVKRSVADVEKNIVRPIAHWKYLSVAANIIPGYGQILSGAVSAAQTARTLYKGKRQQQKAENEFELQAGLAYRQYQEEVLRRNIQPMSFSEFKNAILTQAF